MNSNTEEFYLRAVHLADKIHENWQTAVTTSI